MQEEWRRLIYRGKDYGDWYEVSNLGNIRNSNTKRIRKLNITKKGYYFVNISLGSKQNRKTIRVNKAVAETFIPNPNDLLIVNHRDGNKLNNNVENLEWCTYSENTRHAYNNGLIAVKRGAERHFAKLTNEDVKYIRKYYIPYDKIYGVRGLARKFNVNHVTIIRVIHYKSYKETI